VLIYSAVRTLDIPGGPATCGMMYPTRAMAQADVEQNGGHIETDELPDDSETAADMRKYYPDHFGVALSTREVLPDEIDEDPPEGSGHTYNCTINIDARDRASAKEIANAVAAAFDGVSRWSEPGPDEVG
jgi:hypothetical protein